jgi:hypothetical protein
MSKLFTYQRHEESSIARSQNRNLDALPSQTISIQFRKGLMGSSDGVGVVFVDRIRRED